MPYRETIKKGCLSIFSLYASEKIKITPYKRGAMVLFQTPAVSLIFDEEQFGKRRELTEAARPDKACLQQYQTPAVSLNFDEEQFGKRRELTEAARPVIA